MSGPTCKAVSLPHPPATRPPWNQPALGVSSARLGTAHPWEASPVLATVWPSCFLVWTDLAILLAGLTEPMWQLPSCIFFRYSVYGQFRFSLPTINRAHLANKQACARYYAGVLQLVHYIIRAHHKTPHLNLGAQSADQQREAEPPVSPEARELQNKHTPGEKII